MRGYLGRKRVQAIRRNQGNMMNRGYDTDYINYDNQDVKVSKFHAFCVEIT